MESKIEHSHIFGKYGGGTLLACLFLVLLFGYVILRPFLTIFIIALVLAVLSQPVYNWILKHTRGKENLASLLTCTLVVLVVILPGLMVLGLLGKQSLQFYDWVNQKVQAGLLDQSLREKALGLQQRFFPTLDLAKVDLGTAVTTLAGNFSQFLITSSANILKTLTTTVWEFFLMLLALFFFLKDGDAFIKQAMHLIPLSGGLKSEILGHFKKVSQSAFYGTFLTALAQGVLGGIAFLIVGLPPLVWGVVMSFFSLIPVVGTAIVWLPTAIVLMANHRLGAGIFLILWGALVISTADNVIKTLFMQGKSKLHPMLVFFSILGGLSAFGPLGIILGPLSMVLVIALLQAYEKAAHPVLEELDKL